MVWNNGDELVEGQTHGIGHNVGQHYAMNRLLDEAITWNTAWFIRIDEDAVFESKNWLRQMLQIQKTHMKRYKKHCILSPRITGLRNPPGSLKSVKIGKFNCDVVEILGGICRMAPMNLIRYWRWDERMAMGFSEATTFARYCQRLPVTMLRCQDIVVSHGGSTDTQEEADPDMAYEREMLKLVPYGL